ncbi:TAXI family TRAP transporter solute-binding subunit [Lentibacillus sp. CBA3610]|uniref:TAXI family TRAP transporter solute-binding subunit n=1 Tax=Lentibacillus sp. CBA3610 TaxID=2518176 RepID=UPI0015962B2D|nr:TAXI family TRAP transporter solute-binding subunit [Lentibacillus sp. CBA3610]QKY70275.1 TAXI family TRAP transporter solute-binding subunit [Lentibacillus sp. CBA3610]
MKKSHVVLWLVTIFVIFLAACSEETTDNGENNDAEADSSSSTSLTWAAGAQGGGWYTMAGGISNLIGEHSDIDINTIPGGSMQNMPFIADNEAQLAWMQPPFIQAGVNGESPFEETYDNVSIIGNGFGTNHFHFVVTEDSGIESIEQIFEEEIPIRIGVTPVNNSDEWVFRKFLEFYDSDYETIEANGGEIFHGSYQEQVDAIRNGNVDAIFPQVALPAATITEAAVGADIKILPMSEEVMSYLEEFGLAKNSIPAETYPDVINGDKEIPTASMGNVLTANSNLEEDTVYEITKIINENVNQLPDIHASLEAYSVEGSTNNLIVDLHPGAERYFQETGQIE